MRALVLSGGGSRGAFQAGVLRALTNRGLRWDVIAGVSVGALNGAFMAQFQKEDQASAAAGLSDFWFDIEGNRSIYKRWFPFGKLHGLWKGGIYNTAPIARKVRENLDASRLKTSGVRLLVGCVCLETGAYRYVEGTDQDIHEWVLASSAFPTAFPPRKIEGLSWVDGGVRDITPVTDVLDMRPDEIDVILTGPLDQSIGNMSTGETKNVINVALRTVNLMANEVFNGDLDRVPEADLPRIKIISPPVGTALPDALSFDPAEIRRLYDIGFELGAR